MKTKIVREKDIEKKVRKWCGDHGYLFIKMSALSVVGFPDRMILRYKQVMFLELKAPGKRPRPNQTIWILKLNNLGFEAVWTDNYEDAIDAIRTAFSVHP